MSSKSVTVIEGQPVALPSVYKRKNRHYLRLRVVGQSQEFLTLSTGTDSASVAMSRRLEIERMLRHYGLDNPNATFEELKENLRDYAAQWLSQPVSSVGERNEFIDQLSEASYRLRLAVATDNLSPATHKAITEMLRLNKMAQERLKGNSEALANFVEPNEPMASSVVMETVKAQAAGATFAELVEDLLKEKRLTLKPTSLKDLESCLRSIQKFVPVESGVPMGRLDWVQIRDEMLASGIAKATLNKWLTKAKMVIDYGLLNGRLNGLNPINRLKVTQDDSSRRAFTAEELAQLRDTVINISRPNHRYLALLGMATGSRIGELVQVTPKDIREVEGFLCLSINVENGKTTKNKNSVRDIPLVDFEGFSVAEFHEWVKSLPADKPIIGMSRDTASKKFNEDILKTALTDTEGLSYHALRHSMATFCRSAGVNETDAGAVLGHKPQSITFGLYGSAGRALEAIQTAITKALTKAHLIAA